ncbi:MAG: helix-turn-helix transcriptional regulator [Candidatus Cybelea sp.]|jgi:transcriptional regulator with XRE-family HTH domain
MTRLKFWRLQARLTQREAAMKLGIGESTYGFLESGRMQPSPAQLERLARSFTDPARLFEAVPDEIASAP